MNMDYDIWYKGTIIGNITGISDKEALRNAKAIYGPEVTVGRV